MKDQNCILVTGASGFVGAHIARHFLEQDVEVISISHDMHPISTDKIIGIHDEITWCYGSITDSELIKRIIVEYEIDTVIHAAAMPIERGGYRTTLPYFNTNVIGTANVLDAIREQDYVGFPITYLLISSDKMYGDCGCSEYYENLLPVPNSIYSCSKACADIVSQSYAYSFDLPISVIRICNIYGFGDLNHRVIPSTIESCMDKESPIIYKNLNSIREYIHIDDVCSAVEIVLKNIDITQKQSYNIGSGQCFTQAECVLEILKHFQDLQPLYIDIPDYVKKEIPFQKLSSEKIRNELGWKSRITFADGIKKIIEEYKNVQK